MTNNELNQAMLLFLGYGTNVSPQSNHLLLKKKYGETTANTLLKDINQILQKLNAVNIDWSSVNLVGAGEVAAQAVYSEYPFLDDKALKALAWKFSFDWR